MIQLFTTEKLMFCTTCIATVANDSKKYSATGFFYNYEIEKDDKIYTVPTIITNKHVVKDAVSFIKSRR